MNLRNLIEKLTAKFTRSEELPAEDILNALRRLENNEDFKLYRVLIRSQYSELARSVASCPSESADHIRGQMYAIDKLWNLSAHTFAADLEQQKAISAALAAQYADEGAMII